MQRGAFAQMDFITAPAAGKGNPKKRSAFVGVICVAVDFQLLAVSPQRTGFHWGLKFWDWRADFQPWWLAGCDPQESARVKWNGHSVEQQGDRQRTLER